MRVKQPYTLTRENLSTADVAYRDNAETCYNILYNPIVLNQLERSHPAAASVVHEALLVLERLRLVLGEVKR